MMSAKFPTKLDNISLISLHHVLLVGTPSGSFIDPQTEAVAAWLVALPLAQRRKEEREEE